VSVVDTHTITVQWSEDNDAGQSWPDARGDPITIFLAGANIEIRGGGHDSGGGDNQHAQPDDGGTERWTV